MAVSRRWFLRGLVALGLAPVLPTIPAPTRRVVVSTDAGKTWHAINPPRPELTSVHLDPELTLMSIRFAERARW